MVKLVFKAVFLSVFGASLAFGANALEMARNLINDPSKDAQLRLLFEGRNFTDSNGYVNLAELTRILKANSLFSLNLPSTKSLELSFKSKAKGVLFVKLINDALNQAGFVYFIPTALSYEKDLSVYKISVESKYVLDPASLYNILKIDSVFIENIKKLSPNAYEYSLDFSNARLKPNVSVPLNDATNLRRPMRDYILLSKGAKRLRVRANASDAWFAKVQFLDKDLNFIQSIESTKKDNEIQESIPQNCAYIILGDTYSLDNIRRGLEVTLYN